MVDFYFSDIMQSTPDDMIDLFSDVIEDENVIEEEHVIEEQLEDDCIEEHIVEAEDDRIIVKKFDYHGHVCSCGRSYKANKYLRQHQRWECGIAPNLACTSCPYKTKRKSSLKRHTQTHHRFS